MFALKMCFLGRLFVTRFMTNNTMIMCIAVSSVTTSNRYIYIVNVSSCEKLLPLSNELYESDIS